mmetsp:Transcript_9242/g.10717  ORF Transcript_9242/g.10717 Transcript_9242/m.10717 type:complete len:118 (-) Transcript_9242:175-528(-)
MFNFEVPLSIERRKTNICDYLCADAKERRRLHNRRKKDRVCIYCGVTSTRNKKGEAITELPFAYKGHCITCMAGKCMGASAVVLPLYCIFGPKSESQKDTVRIFDICIWEKTRNLQH